MSLIDTALGKVNHCDLGAVEAGEIFLVEHAAKLGYQDLDRAAAKLVEAIDPDGWFATGVLGEVDADGYVRITGRKKEIIVTAGGKNVAPALLEDRLRAHPLISQAMAVGDQQPFIAALITIDPEAFPGWKERNGKAANASVGDLAEDPDLTAVRDDPRVQALLGG